ncbi:MAG: hypothetical protein FAZ92_02727 [Accumulibacter sp.]|nr:MAG: hypothetical protein FAZ92_02727 [Accumulibacter sp.]
MSDVDRPVSLPAMSVTVAVKVLLPSAPKSAVVTSTQPLLMSVLSKVTLPTATPLDLMVTLSPATAVVPLRLTRAVGVSSLLRLSVAEVPVSETARTSGAPGA